MKRKREKTKFTVLLSEQDRAALAALSEIRQLAAADLFRLWVRTEIQKVGSR